MNFIESIVNWYWKIKAIASVVKDEYAPELTTSKLYNEYAFYTQFEKDLLKAKKEVTIESPFITKKRLLTLLPCFSTLVHKGVKITIVTRDPQEHESTMVEQAEEALYYFSLLGIKVIFSQGGHHRKLAIIDKRVAWEGSLNILSQCQSREIMRRIESNRVAKQLVSFLNRT